MLRFILPAPLPAWPAFAQITALPPEIRAALHPPPAVPPLRDQSYGPDPRHRPDTFPPGADIRKLEQRSALTRLNIPRLRASAGRFSTVFANGSADQELSIPLLARTNR